MKKIILCLVLFCCATVAYCQPMPDSLKTKYRLAKTDDEKGRCLYTYLVMIKASFADSITIAHAVDLFTWLKQQNDVAGADYAELYLAYALVFKGDYSAALNLAAPILSRFEKRQDAYGIMNSNHVIGMAFLFAKNYEQSFEYLKKVIPLAQTIDAKESLSNIYNDISVAYALAVMPDSGLVYAQKAVNIDTENKDYERLGISLSTLAENYMAANEYDIAIPFLRKSMGYYLTRMKEQNSFGIAYVNNDFAQAFLAIKQYDSANYYAHQSIQISGPLGYREQTMRSYEYLYKSFEETKKQDSVNKYFRLAMTAKDSLYSMDKTRNMEAMSFREQMRQQELAAEKVKVNEERKQNIQFALIAFGIISFIIIFLLLSRSFITNTKLIEFLGVIALLIVFEFLNLLLHPFLERVTNHSPVLMLLALVCIAALLVPLHHRVEKWATAKLVEKNKKIRLAAAKKTIEQLQHDFPVI
ncbi:MAG: hypothetical protein ABIO79_02415 [Ferruginibacter sp.]